MKQPEEMTLSEAEAEFLNLDGYFMRCKEIQQGINSKESVRFLLLVHRICQLSAGTSVFSEYERLDALSLSIVHVKRIDAILRLRSQVKEKA